MLTVFIIAGIFLGIMIPTLFVSAMPGITVKILELLKIFRQGSLKINTADYITGAGYYRRGKVYEYTDKEGNSRFASGRVFGFLVLIFIPLFIIISVALYLLMGLK